MDGMTKSELKDALDDAQELIGIYEDALREMANIATSINGEPVFDIIARIRIEQLYAEFQEDFVYGADDNDGWDADTAKIVPFLRPVKV